MLYLLNIESVFEGLFTAIVLILIIWKNTKDHKCDYCEKFFYQCSNLKTQTKIVHDGKKDYKCEQCGK